MVKWGYKQNKNLNKEKYLSFNVEMYSANLRDGKAFTAVNFIKK